MNKVKEVDAAILFTAQRLRQLIVILNFMLIRQALTSVYFEFYTSFQTVMFYRIKNSFTTVYE